MVKKLLLFVVVVLGFAAHAAAQNRPVSGTVTDSQGAPVIGAAVVIQGTTVGIATDANGKFTLSTPPRGTFISSAVGFKATAVAIDGRTQLDIVMEEEATSIDDVVVVAYGTASRASLTGSVASVKGDAIEKRPTTSATAALEGAAPGIQVNSSYGQPGNDPTIRIRGFGSVNGTNNPLYVIDGVPYGGNISDLNSTDIESISVLKDAASAALYGNRASNGVILITTRQGRKDKLTLNLTMKQGIYERGIKEYDRLGIKDWMEVQWRGLKNSGMSDPALGYNEADAIAYAHENIMATRIQNNIFNLADDQLYDDNGRLNPAASVLPGYTDLDWFDEIERLGHRQEYTVSADVGGEKYSVFSSLGYLKENGYTHHSDFKRFSGRANLSYRPTKWFRTGMNLAASSQESSYIANADGGGTAFENPFYIARYMAPVYPVFKHDAEGAILYENGRPVYNDADYLSNRNTVYENMANHDKLTRETMNLQAFATITFLKDFQFTVKGDMSVRNSREEEYDNPEIGDGKGNNGRWYFYNYRYKNYTFQQQLNWGHDFGQHHVDAMLAHESYKYRYDYAYSAKKNIMLPGLTTGSNFSDLTSISAYYNTYTTESYLGRLRYNFDERYFVEGSYRRDGSSRFHPDYRWGGFWSLGASWMISREEFMRNVGWVNDLKFRVAYGETGNDQGVGYYAYKPFYTSNKNQGMGAFYKGQLAADDIQWETTATFDIALEGRLWNRVNVSLDYFDKRSRDLLFDVQLPLSVGATSTDDAIATVTRNIGSVSNKGIEVAVDVDVLRKKDWRWNIGANLTWIRNKIVKLPDHKDIPNGSRRYSEGHSIYEFYYYHFEGVDQMTGNSLYTIADEYNIDLLDPNDKNSVGGTKATKDTQEYDVVINGKRYTRNTTYASRDWRGSALPTVYGSLSTSLSWKNLTLSALCTYSIGGKIYASSYASLMSVRSSGADATHKDVLKSWNGIPEGMTETSPDRIDPNGIPVVDTFLSTYNNAASDRWLKDNSYFAIKNISLSYQFPKRICSKMGLGGLSVDFSVENPAIFSAMKGLNPQYSFSGGDGNTFVSARVYSIGLNIKL